MKAPVKATGKADSGERGRETRRKHPADCSAGEGDPDHGGPQASAGHKHAAEGRLLWREGTRKVRTSQIIDGSPCFTNGNRGQVSVCVNTTNLFPAMTSDRPVYSLRRTAWSV